MQRLIYYPTFEPPDKEWLKFSLLYLEEFQPIVPYNRRDEFSDEYKKLIDETDLINPFSPDYSQGNRASFKAIQEAEAFLSAERRSGPFKTTRLKEKWQDVTQWNYLIYEEKFSYDFVQFCKDNKIGKRISEGLLLPDELGFIFMTHLAKEIAYDRDASIITDHIKFDDYTNISRTISKGTQKRNKFAKGIINLIVPQNLGYIDFNQLIEFRTKNRELISVFNHEIDRMQESIGNAVTERSFIDSYNHIYSEISKTVLLTGIGIASLPFAAYILINNPNALAAEYVKETLGGLGVILGGTYALDKLWIDMKDKRYCKKYLANLARLKPA